MDSGIVNSRAGGSVFTTSRSRIAAFVAAATLALLSPLENVPDCFGDSPVAETATGGDFGARRAMAESYEAEGDWTKALRTWVSAAEELDLENAVSARSYAGALIDRLREEPASVTERHFEEIEPILHRAVKMEIEPASMLLGEEFRRQGRAEDAFQIFRKSASKGYAPAMIQVGLMYSNGDGVKKDLEKASSWLRPANVKGDAVGKYLLAECFLFGKGVAKNPSLAVTLLEESVEMEGPARALDLLGTCHHKSWGVEQDSAKAANLYELSCERGFYNACANLSVLAMRGDGIEQNPERAIALLEKGADAGNALCMFFYGAAFLDGLGVSEDPEAAAEWMKKAAALDNENAKKWCREQGLSWEKE